MAKLYDWGDGKKIHTISKAQHDQNVQKALDAQRVLKPPPGTYDPNLDAVERASGRGLQDLVQDVDLGRQRGFTDFGLGQADLNTQRTQLGEDYATGQAAVERNYGRSLADLLKQREQGTQDYGSSVQTLQRNYTNLGEAQGEQQRKAGAFEGGGAALQAARKREANQAIDRAPIDTAYQRFMGDSQTAQGRLGEDKATSLNDLLTGFNRGTGAIDTGGGQLGLNYARSMEDLTSQLSRAQRENTEFGIDTAAARQAQYGGPVITVPGAKQTASQASKAAQAAAAAAHAKAVAAAKKKARR